MERTGLLGMFMLVSTSTLCVASIFVPGSPFLNNIYGAEEMKQENLGDNMSEPTMGEAEEQEHSGNNMSELTMEEAEALITQYDFAHITILIAGIIIARFGKKLLHNDNVEESEIIQTTPEREHFSKHSDSSAKCEDPNGLSIIDRQRTDSRDADVSLRVKYRTFFFKFGPEV